jgi:hypothetical protein
MRAAPFAKLCMVRIEDEESAEPTSAMTDVVEARLPVNSKLSGLSPVEFDLLVEEIDSELKAEDVPIHARPMKAVEKLSSRFHTRIVIARCAPGVPGYHGNDGTWDRLDAWYKKRYGDRLKTDMTPGQFVMLIRGDPYRVRVPRVFGRVQFFIDPARIGEVTEPAAKFARYNILNAFEGLTSDYAQSLSAAELKGIFAGYMNVVADMDKVEDALDVDHGVAVNNLVREGKADLLASVHHIFAHPPNYGQARWSAAQATEKHLKGFIASGGREFARTHDLAKDLLPVALELGWDDDAAEALVLRAECAAGVRYGEQPSTMNQAVDAARAALTICASLAECMLKRKGHPGEGLEMVFGEGLDS